MLKRTARLEVAKQRWHSFIVLIDLVYVLANEHTRERKWECLPSCLSFGRRVFSHM